VNDPIEFAITVIRDAPSAVWDDSFQITCPPVVVPDVLFPGTVVPLFDSTAFPVTNHVLPVEAAPAPAPVSEWPGGDMVDASFSRHRQQEDRVAGVRRQIPIFAVGLAVILIGLGWVLLQRGFSGNSSSGSPILPPRHRRKSQKSCSKLRRAYK
jgi:hypothetical protein